MSHHLSKLMTIFRKHFARNTMSSLSKNTILCFWSLTSQRLFPHSHCSFHWRFVKIYFCQDMLWISGYYNIVENFLALDQSIIIRLIILSKHLRLILIFSIQAFFYRFELFCKFNLLVFDQRCWWLLQCTSIALTNLDKWIGWLVLIVIIVMDVIYWSICWV